MAPKSSPAAKDPDVHQVERLSTPYSTNAPAFGSDVVAETLSALDIPYIALNPGASYRGLHDSIVNFLGNEQPQMILCLHEEAAVAIAASSCRQRIICGCSLPRKLTIESCRPR